MKPSEKNHYKNETLSNVISFLAALLLVLGMSIYAFLAGEFSFLGLLSHALNYIPRIVSSSSYFAKILDDFYVWMYGYHRNLFHVFPSQNTVNGVEEEKIRYVSKELVGAALGFLAGMVLAVVLMVLGALHYANLLEIPLLVFSTGGLLAAVFARFCRMFDPKKKYDDTVTFSDILKQQVATKISILIGLAASIAILSAVVFFSAVVIPASSFILLTVVVTAGMISGIHYVGRLIDAIHEFGPKAFFAEMKNLFHRGDSKIDREKLFLFVGLVVGIALTVAILASPIGPPLLLTGLMGTGLLTNVAGFFGILGGIVGTITRLFGRTQDQRHEMQKKEIWTREKTVSRESFLQPSAFRSFLLPTVRSGSAQNQNSDDQALNNDPLDCLSSPSNN